MRAGNWFHFIMDDLDDGTQHIEKDWMKSLKRRYAGISIGHFLPAKNSINFYSNQSLDF